MELQREHVMPKIRLFLWVLSLLFCSCDKDEPYGEEPATKQVMVNFSTGGMATLSTDRTAVLCDNSADKKNITFPIEPSNL